MKYKHQVVFWAKLSCAETFRSLLRPVWTKWWALWKFSIFSEIEYSRLFCWTTNQSVLLIWLSRAEKLLSLLRHIWNKWLALFFSKSNIQVYLAVLRKFLSFTLLCWDITETWLNRMRKNFQVPIGFSCAETQLIHNWIDWQSRK